MTSLLLPQSAINRMREEQLVQDAGQAARLLPALKAIDERCDFVLANDRPADRRLRPGFWHIRRRNDGGMPDSFMVIQTPEGGWCEPSDRHLDELRGRDSWRTGVLEEMLRWDREQDARADERYARGHQERVDELYTRIKAATFPSYNFGTKGWRNRLGGD